jgi:DNA-binding NarL/FixJ family response regulator
VLRTCACMGEILKQTGSKTASASREGTETDGDEGSTSPARPAYDVRNTSRQPRAGGDAYDRLTGRERWIVSQLVKYKGAPNKVIAHALQISPNTLRNHLASIFAKLGVRRRVELVLYAMERGVNDARDS